MRVESFKKQVTRTVQLDYLLYNPEQATPLPLVLFLHGYGERGSDPNILKIYGPPLHIEQGEQFPFILAAPQCPMNAVWPEQTEELNALVDHLIATNKVDEKRIYVTGLSMGGYGTWYLASRCPERFAAIAPVCGGGGWWMIDRLKHLPAWVFHGDADTVVPISESQFMVNRLREEGGDVRFTVYPGVGHDSWTATYSNPELYEWLLGHSL